MSEPAELQIDLLKPAVQAIFDEARRLGPQASRAAKSEVEARFRQAATVANFDKGSLDCAGLHVLAAVAMDIYLDQQGQEGAIIALLDAFSAQQAADDCEAAATAAASEPG